MRQSLVDTAQCALKAFCSSTPKHEFLQDFIDDKLELLKSVKLVGNGPGKTKIKGAFNIKSNVQFENLSLEITKGTYCLKI